MNRDHHFCVRLAEVRETIINNLLLTALAVIPLLLTAGCGGDYQVISPPATPTATGGIVALEDTRPTPTSTPEPSATPRREPTASFTVHDLDVEPWIGTVFETLLSKLPDNQATRGYTRLGDVAGVVAALGLDLLPPGSSFEDISQYSRQFSAPEFNGFYPPLWGWPAELRDYAGSMNTYPDLAFDFASVEQFTRSDNFFLQFQDGAGLPVTYDVALGSFDTAATTAALSTCDCEQPEIREHNGIEYFAWSDGDGRGDMQRRLNRPFYDHIGRGPHLLVRDGEAYYAIFDGVIDEHIEVIQGIRPSLADADGYPGAVQLMTALGIVSEISLRGSGFTTEVVVERFPRVKLALTKDIESDPMLLPFEFAATGVGYDGQRVFTGLVIAHGDAESAEANVARLLTRLQNGVAYRRGASDFVSWAERVDRVDIRAYNQFLVARIYFTNAQGPGTLTIPNTLLIYE